MDELHPRVAEIIGELERTQEEMVELMASIPEAQVEAPVGEGQWTIAQHVEHLAIVEDGTGRLISKLIKQVEAQGEREMESSSQLQSLDKFRVWQVVKPITAPESVQPSGTVSGPEALERLSTARARLIDALRRASGLALGTASYPHPVVGPLNIYQWGLIASQHQRRHIELIHRILGRTA
jgi:hypothetical protein